MSVPPSIRDDSFELDAKAIIVLYSLVLPDTTTFLLSPKREYTWLGNVYEEMPCHMSQMSRTADGKMNRPKFSFVNPQGIFTAAVSTGALENAVVSRIRVSKQDLDNNVAASLTESYRVSRIANVNRDMIVLDLRGALDGAAFTLPIRSFNPPTFPHVKLS